MLLAPSFQHNTWGGDLFFDGDTDVSWKKARSIIWATSVTL